MKVTTTPEQREAWKKVHVALSDYYIRFGAIEVGEGTNKVLLDMDSRYTRCGEIYCPNKPK